MLSRTAESIFWIGRLIERAESMARLVEMGHRMNMIPASGAGHRSEWRSIIAAAGQIDAFEATGRAITQRSVCNFLIFDTNNASSIASCLKQAKENGRAVRAALTSEMWMALNDTWLEIRDQKMSHMSDLGLQTFLDWVKTRCAWFRGATETAALRADGYDFLQIGTFVERADNMARLLDVKYYVLLPESEAAGGGVDSYQWTTILRAVSSLRAYHHIYRADYQPWHIADFLILNTLSPRSLAYCYERIGTHLTRLSKRYGARRECQTLADGTIAHLHDHSMAEIFQHGLHEFLSDFIQQNNQLAQHLSKDFHFGWR